MTIFQYRLKQSKVVITATGLSVIVLLGFLDYVTGAQISFSVFYLLPISFVTWFTNRQSGNLSAIFSAITWLTADLTSETAYISNLIPYWNATVRLLVFLAIVFLESALKELNQGLEERVKDRTDLLAEEVRERKKAEEQLQHYAKRLEILHEIDRAILAAESIETIAQTTILHVKNLLPCDRVSLILFDLGTHQTDMFEVSEQVKNTDSLRRDIPMDLFPDFNAAIETLLQHGPWTENELQSLPMASSILSTLHFQDFRSLIISPILVQEELIGSLHLMAYHPDTFSSEHSEIGREVANQLGIAIRHARMVAQLRTDQENLQSLSQRILEIQESERRNIARELHDEIGQALTGIGITLEMATQVRTKTMHDRLKQAQTLVIELMERVSQLSLDLRPALLDDMGLIPTLLWFSDRYSSQTNITATLKHSGLEEKRFAPEIETAAYRIVQEALTNVARHAHVNTVKVTIWFDQNILGIQVEDEGSGFDPEQELAKGNSSGLLGMQERISLLGGKITIESAIGLGTRLLAEVPSEMPVYKEGEMK